MGSLRGCGSRGEGTREPLGTLRKLREYWGRIKTTRLPTPLGPTPLKDSLTDAASDRADIPVRTHFPVASLANGPQHDIGNCLGPYIPAGAHSDRT